MSTVFFCLPRAGTTLKRKPGNTEEDEDDDYQATVGALLRHAAALSEYHNRRFLVHHVVCCVTIHHATGIDDPFTNPSAACYSRVYRVIYHIKPGEEFLTAESEGLPDPVWNSKECIPLSRLGKYEMVLDVVRVRGGDPETSTGMVLVGSAAIPLPKKLYRKTTKRVALAKLAGQGWDHPVGGHLAVSMELKHVELVPSIVCVLGR
ncbi:hypothetical protein FH972_001364 [Carpinus fangiana]|uniref:C2 domain-containing protein n=1 Tax=Carpinus fangiana TaxID=176857 RepID=A0A5N6QDD6_9ROSI|nr:hypothetical protein FH972_001364 [Carpinus fangiana]